LLVEPLIQIRNQVQAKTLVVDARIQAEGQLDSPRLDEPENETQIEDGRIQVYAVETQVEGDQIQVYLVESGGPQKNP